MMEVFLFKQYLQCTEVKVQSSDIKILFVLISQVA